MAFINGQPWMFQPWNDEQDAETLGPWTCKEGSLNYGHFSGAIVTNGRVYFPEYNTKRVWETIIRGGIIADSIRPSAVDTYLYRAILCREKASFIYNKINIPIEGGTGVILFDQQNQYVSSIDGNYWYVDAPHIATKDKVYKFYQSSKSQTIDGKEIDRNEFFEVYYSIDENDDIRKTPSVGKVIGKIGSIETVAKVLNPSTGRSRIYFFHTGKNNDYVNFYYSYADSDGDGYLGQWSGKTRFMQLPRAQKNGMAMGAIDDCATVVTTKKRLYYLFKHHLDGGTYKRLGVVSARINEDASLSDFLYEDAEVNEGPSSLSAFLDASGSDIFPVITGQRLYLFNAPFGYTSYGVGGEISYIWTPFKGGRDDYTGLTHDDTGGGGGGSGGGGENISSGRYDVRPEVRARGDARANAVQAHYEIAPVVGGHADSAAQGTSRGRYELFSDVSGAGEVVAAGTFRAAYALAPGVRGQSMLMRAASGNIRLAPTIHGTVDEPPGFAAVAGHTVMPMFAVGATAYVRHMGYGHVALPPPRCRGTVSGKRPANGRGGWSFAPTMAGGAIVRHSSKGGRYVLPAPHRMRGAARNDDDGVLRYRRRHVL